MHSETPLRILLIEDRTVAAITLECLLEDMGHKVVSVAATPPQAERALARAPEEVDLVIYDAFLMGLPSLNIAEKVKWSHVAAVVTSIKPEGDLRALGFDAPYLAQPFTDVGVSRAVSTGCRIAQLSAA